LGDDRRSQGEHDEQIAALRARIERAEMELGNSDVAMLSIARAVHEALVLDAELQRAQVTNYKRLLDLVELANLGNGGEEGRALDGNGRAAQNALIPPVPRDDGQDASGGSAGLEAGSTSRRSRKTAGRLVRRTLWLAFLILPFAAIAVLALSQSWDGDTRRDASQAASRPAAEDKRSAASPDGATWELAWHDEFNKPRCPSEAKWDFEHGFVRNGELQWYQPDNASCEHGVLVIEARHEPRRNPNYRPASTNWRLNRPSAAYTSASLASRHSFTYGRVEVRARLDPRRGSWPAIWTLGTAYRHDPTAWPATGEVDIMEYYRHTLLANVCKPKHARCGWSSKRRSLGHLGGHRWAERFHTWSMEWTARKIDLFVDGKLTNHFVMDRAVGRGDRNPYVNKPAFLLLSQAIGGANAADPTNTEFPMRLEVGYVRIYERPGASPPHIDGKREGPRKA
jgi:beta-glucanase (GH16 family)